MSENNNPYEEDLDIIYEDDDVKLIDVMTKKGLRYLLPDFNTQDLTDVSSEFGVFSEDIYFVVGKDPEAEIFMLKDYEDGTRILNVTSGFKNSQATDVRDIISKYPQLKENINKIFKGGETFEYLKSIMSGKREPSWNDDYPFIGDVEYNSDRPSSSVVIIKFEDSDDFLDVFGIDQDDRYYYNDVNHPYHYRDTDTYWYFENWRDGEMISRDFDERNVEKFDHIISLISPGLLNSDIKDKVKKFDDLFGGYSEDFINEYASDYQDCVSDNVRDEINSEFNNPFIKFGIKEINPHHKYEVNISVLLTWFKQLNMIGFDVKDLLKKLIEKFDKKSRGDWSELEYSIGCPDFDYEGLNDKISDTLDNIIDSIEDSEEFLDFNEYNRYLEYIQSLGGFNETLQIPKTKDKVYSIVDLDKLSNKATIRIRSNQGGGDVELRKLSIDELNSFLHNYELFNENKLKLWKIMKEIY